MTGDQCGVGPRLAGLVVATASVCAAAAAAELDGGRDVYLGLAHAESSKCGWRTARDGASVTGSDLRIGALTFERGIGTHASAELVFRARGRYRWLNFWAGVSTDMTDNGSITVQVWLDGRKAHETPVMRVKGEPRYVSLAVAGADEIRFVGTDAGNGIGADHVNLGNLRLCLSEEEPVPDRPRQAVTVVPATDVGAFMPERGAASVVPAREWEYAFVSGNGRMGAMVFGHPLAEKIVANHCRLFLPLGNREIVPDLARYVPELRKIIRERGYGEAMGFFLGKAREQGYPGLVWTDPFHPGFELGVRMECEGAEARGYCRTEDFRTGEVTVRWEDDSGPWSRRLFVSRTENVVALSIKGPRAGAVACALEARPVPHELIRSELSSDEGGFAYRNAYVKGKGGYDAAVRVVARGGEAVHDGDTVRVTGADEVVALMRIVPYKAGERGDLAGLKAALDKLPADYDALLRSHAKAHSAIFDRVTFDLGGGADRKLTSEALLDRARDEVRLPAALLEKMYDAGRYTFISAAGELPPNLQGIWTGTWTPSWSGDFTTDTNLQLAIKSGLSANMPESMVGYYRFVEEFLPDFRENARKYYGCRGIMAPTRISNTGKMLHWGGWDGIWWTAGAGWLAGFFYDHYRYTGDRDFLAKRTIPLLKEVALFYEDFMLIDGNGKYEFLPSYSPESGSGITSTMDVTVAREVFTDLIEGCTDLGIERENVAKWKAMLARMPEYRVNSDGALAEWVPEGRGESYGHRHLSHLHAAYEATDDFSPKDERVWKAAQEATRRRINSGGEQSTHGRMHMGLAAAYLRMPEEARGRLAVMATKRSMYPSLITAHEPGPGIFNCDANGSIPEIVNRMLFSSWPGRLDIMPALPKALPKGEIRGVLARGQITIDRLAWDRTAGRIELEFTSSRRQTVTLCVPGVERLKSVSRASRGASVKPSPEGDNCRLVTVARGRRVSLAIEAEAF